MKKGIYSVHDSKAGVFALPFFMPNQAMALRAFSGEAQNPQSELFKFSSDFTLYHLGGFDDEFGTFEMLPQPVAIANASQFKE